MRLVFYSGGYPDENYELDNILLKHLAPKRPQVTYIPSSSDDADVHFRDFVRWYQRFNVKRFINFPVDVPISHTMLYQVLCSDIIHLSGGNTFYFLKHLRSQGLLKLLQDYSAEGGIITGLSAGAILMTPDITTASFPTFDCDDNYDGVTNFSAMGLVNFEFFPHYRNSKRYEQELRLHSKSSKRPIIACPDGSGVVVNSSQITLVGKPVCFHNGDKLIIKTGL